MRKSPARSCPICSAGVADVKHTQRVAVPDELGFSDTFDVVACAECGCVFADIPNRQSDIDDSYKDHSKYADTSLYADESKELLVSDAPWDVERLRGVAEYLANIVEFRDARILDAGCATGTFLGFLKNKGFTSLWGLEPSPLATATARRLHGVEAITGSFITPPVGIGTFDVITLSHVLEHLTDVRAAVRSMYALLNPGGLVYIEVPDASRYAEYIVAPYHDFNTEHINHFSLSVVHQLLESEGFEKVETGEKLVMCSARYLYPAIYGTWRKPHKRVPARNGWNYDARLVNSIDRYIKQSSQLMHRIDATLQDQLRDDHDVTVWGAGQLSMKLLRDTVLATKNVVTIVDGSTQKHGLHMNGVVVAAPAEIAGSTLPIVVTSIHHEEAIRGAILRELGPDRRIISISPPDGRD